MNSHAFLFGSLFASFFLFMALIKSNDSLIVAILATVVPSVFIVITFLMLKAHEQNKDNLFNVLKSSLITYIFTSVFFGFIIGLLSNSYEAGCGGNKIVEQDNVNSQKALDDLKKLLEQRQKNTSN